MTTTEVLQKFFGDSAASLSVEKQIITGYASLQGREVCVFGTADGTYIDNAAALRLAEHVLDCVTNHAGVPIVMFVDSSGQEPNRTAEMLGLAGYFAHLLSCLEVARNKGHKLITVATGKAIGGAFICYGMSADSIYALDTASVGLMPVEAMSAVTKIPVETLKELSQRMPALEFGAEPFSLLGGVREVWKSDADLPTLLTKAIADATSEDQRAVLGRERGGRKLAADVRDRVLAAASQA
jgi:malonate decarboxylase gamma subunit